MEKTSVFNLIILDESGSMSNCTEGTISGCNETLNVARSIQDKFKDKQNSFISIYAFQSDSSIPSRYICKNEKVENVKNITHEDYKPWGCTPLLDAIGSTLIDLKSVASTHEDAMGIVTIITDGYENASTQYTWSQVRDLISQLKELGWTFNFIGANIDVDKVSQDLNIDNRMTFKNDNKGTHQMYQEVSNCLMAEACERVFEEADMSLQEKQERRKFSSKKFLKF